MEKRFEGKSHFAFGNKYGGDPLYGNMDGFKKEAPDHRLKSNFLGPDCLTRPQLCNNGFSASFDVKGNASFILQNQVFSSIFFFSVGNLQSLGKYLFKRL